jgi:hypothetical protein
LEKLEQPVEEDMWARALRDWQRIDSIYRKSKLMIKSDNVISIKPVLFEEDEDVAEEMGEWD